MFLKKLKQKKGETLTETLGSLLIIVPGMVMLAGALVSASNINMQMKETNVSNFPKYETVVPGVGGTIKTSSLTGTDGATSGITLNWQSEDKSIYYYMK